MHSNINRRLNNIMYDSTPVFYSKQNRGGRISSPELRETIELSHDFCGLEENIKPFDLLTLVKRAGKTAGFSAKMIELLEHYMVLTRECDWEEGSQPIVYKSQSATAMDLGLSERHIRRLEKELFEIGALTWKDSGNHKRYGQRCSQTGRILYAFGVDLTPLAYLKPKLEKIIHEQQLYKAAWMETKRQISWHRSQVKAILSEMGELNIAEQGDYNVSYEDIAIRYNARTSLESMRELLVKHQTLYQQLLDVLDGYYNKNKISKESCKTDSNDLHKQDTNNKKSNKLDTRKAKAHCFQTSCNENCGSKEEELQKSESRDEEENLILQTGLQHISLKQALNAASDEFREHLPIEPRPMNWHDFVEAAYKLKNSYGISQSSWAQACVTLGRTGAAICILLTDQATKRDQNRVTKPAGYFNAMLNKARVGELHLHKSIFGILKAE